MKKSTVFLSLVFAAALTCVSAYSAAQVTASPDTTPITEQDQAELKIDGVSLKKPTGDFTISEAKAIELASQYSPGYATEAKNIKAEKQLLTNDHMNLFSNSAKEKNPKLKKEGKLIDTPVYIVTFKGITKVGHDGGINGKKPSIHHEYNLVVDANSGEILYGFSYR